MVNLELLHLPYESDKMLGKRVPENYVYGKEKNKKESSFNLLKTIDDLPQNDWFKVITLTLSKIHNFFTKET